MTNRRNERAATVHPTLATMCDAHPPADIQAEQSLLGAIMLHGGALAHIDTLVVAEDFYDGAHGTIFAALRQLALDGHDPSDIGLLVSRLRAAKQLEAVGGYSELNRIALACSNHTNAAYYAAIVADRAKRRRILSVALATAGAALEPNPPTDDLLASAEANLRAVEHQASSPLEPIGQVAAKKVQDLRRQHAAGTPPPSVFSGIPGLDDAVGGFCPEELVVIAARAGAGKSTFALQVAMHNAKQGRHVMFVSLEMSSAEIVMRRLAGIAFIDSRVIRNGTYDTSTIECLELAATQVRDTNLSFWAPSSATADRIAATARLANAQSPLAAIVVDYLNLIAPADPYRRRHEQVDEITKSLKRLARDMHCPVIALAQLNREAEGEVPLLRHLRESGAIEQDADLVLFLHGATDDDPHETNCDIIVAKHRAGQTGTMPLKWFRQAGLFASREGF